jgi:hypothetical protein
VYRLRFALGLLDTDAQFVEMAQLALLAGFPDEAKRVLDKGFAGGALGTGAEADRHKRLRELVAKNVAEDQKTLLRDEAAAAAAPTGRGSSTSLRLRQPRRNRQGHRSDGEGAAQGGHEVPGRTRRCTSASPAMADAGRDKGASRFEDGKGNRLARRVSRGSGSSTPRPAHP